MSDSIVCRFNHVALSVDNLDAAVTWYTDTLGFRQTVPNAYMSREMNPEGVIFQIYGDELYTVKVAYLGIGNQIGFELFEFVGPRYEGNTIASPKLFDQKSWTSGGFFHIAVTTADPDMLATKVEQSGGRRVGKTVILPNGETALYVQDPWGNAIEIVSTDFEALVCLP